jgi:hypothetical protein
MATLAKIADDLVKSEIPEKPQTCMIYGPPKTGKSALAAKLAGKYNIIWIDVDKGSQVLFTAVPKEHWDKIELIETIDDNNNPRGIRSLTKLFKATGPVTFCAAHGDIMCPLCLKPTVPGFTVNPKTLTTKTVIVVDSLSRISDSAMAHALGQQGEMTFKKKEYSHYDNQGLLLKGILTLAQYMKCHVVWISHEEELQHEDGTSKITPVGGTRNFSRSIARYFDHVIYTSIRNKKYCISSLGTSDIRVQSGTRNNVDVKTADDFINIFSVQHIIDGKTSNFTFSHEASEIEAEETLKTGAAAKVSE